jgi:hypothetical protein
MKVITESRAKEIIQLALNNARQRAKATGVELTPPLLEQMEQQARQEIADYNFAAKLKQGYDAEGITVNCDGTLNMPGARGTRRSAVNRADNLLIPPTINFQDDQSASAVLTRVKDGKKEETDHDELMEENNRRLFGTLSSRGSYDGFPPKTEALPEYVEEKKQATGNSRHLIPPTLAENFTPCTDTPAPTTNAGTGNLLVPPRIDWATGAIV